MQHSSLVAVCITVPVPSMVQRVEVYHTGSSVTQFDVLARRALDFRVKYTLCISGYECRCDRRTGVDEKNWLQSKPRECHLIWMQKAVGIGFMDFSATEVFLLFLDQSDRNRGRPLWHLLCASSAVRHAAKRCFLIYYYLQALEFQEVRFIPMASVSVCCSLWGDLSGTIAKGQRCRLLPCDPTTRVLQCFRFTSARREAAVCGHISCCPISPCPLVRVEVPTPVIGTKHFWFILRLWRLAFWDCHTQQFHSIRSTNTLALAFKTITQN